MSKSGVLKELFKKVSEKIKKNKQEKESAREQSSIYDTVVNSVLNESKEEDDEALKLQNPNYEKIKSIVALFNKLETQYIAGKLHYVYVALTNLNRDFIDIMTEMEKKASYLEGTQKVSSLLEQEALRNIYDAITKPLCNGVFKSIADLVKLESKIKFFVLLYNSGLSHKEVVKKLAEKMGANKGYIEEIFKEIKNITKEKFAWNFSFLTAEQIRKIYEEFGLLDAYHELGKRAKVIVSNLVILKERMPELFLKVKSHVEEIFDKSGCKINIEETLALFEKNRLQQGQIPLTEETAISVAEKFKKFEEKIGNKVDAEKYNDFIKKQKREALKKAKSFGFSYRETTKTHNKVRKSKSVSVDKPTEVEVKNSKTTVVRDSSSSDENENFVIHRRRQSKAR